MVGLNTLRPWLPRAGILPGLRDSVSRDVGSGRGTGAAAVGPDVV